MAKARIKAAKITYISLCPKGMTGMQTLYKEDTGKIELRGLAKADEEGMLTAVVYAPDLSDKEGHEAPAEVIAKFAKEYVRDHRNIDMRHDEKALPAEQAYLAHSWIISKAEVEHPEGRFHGMKNDQGQPIDPTGGWAVGIQLESEELRKQYRTDEWGGVSMFGDAVLEVLEKEDAGDVADRIVNELARKLGATKETEMTPEELAAALAKSNDTLIEKLVKALTPEPKTEPVKKEDTVVADAPVALKYEGDHSPESLNEFFKSKQRASLVERIEKASSADEMASISAELAELSADEPTDAEVGIKKEDTAEIRTMRRRLFKMEKVGTQKVAKSEIPGGVGELGELFPMGDIEALSKEDATEGAQEAALIAAMINDENGQELTPVELKLLGRS